MLSIVGGSGFIGSSLSKNLSKTSIDFQIIDKRTSPIFPEKTIICDICDLSQLKNDLNGDTIIHLAAEHRDDVQPLSRYKDVNVTGTQNVIHVAREKNINRIVFTSTVAVYGFAPSETNEKGDINPFNEYGKTKFQAEELLRAWQAEEPKTRSLIIIRPTVVFGQGNRGNVYNLLSFISSGKFIMIGNGENKKSMAYVKNIAAFLQHMVNFGSGVYLYNYVDKPDLNMNTLVSKTKETLNGRASFNFRAPYILGLIAAHGADFISRISGKKLPISAIRVKKFCATTTFSSAAHEVQGFKSEYTLEDGIRETLESDFISPDPDSPVFYSE